MRRRISQPKQQPAEPRVTLTHCPLARGPTTLMLSAGAPPGGIHASSSARRQPKLNPTA
jgi:hypothetical protein